MSGPLCSSLANLWYGGRTPPWAIFFRFKQCFGIFTVYNSSCGKVMFLFIHLSVRGGGCLPLGPGVVYSQPQADTSPPTRQPLQRTLRILLECILVSKCVTQTPLPSSRIHPSFPTGFAFRSTPAPNIVIIIICVAVTSCLT